MYNLIITAILVVAFFMRLEAYMLGLQHGKQLDNKIIPSVIKTPIQAIQEHEEAKKVKAKQDKEAVGWANLMAYDGTPQA